MNKPDLIFHSSLTIDEIEENFKDFDIFNEVMEGLQEALIQEKSKEQSIED